MNAGTIDAEGRVNYMDDGCLMSVCANQTIRPFSHALARILPSVGLGVSQVQLKAAFLFMENTHG